MKEKKGTYIDNAPGNMQQDRIVNGEGKEGICKWKEEEKKCWFRWGSNRYQQ